MTTIFETKDGKQFANEEEAKAYEYKLTLLEGCLEVMNKISKFIPTDAPEEKEFCLLKKFLDEETKKYKQDS